MKTSERAATAASWEHCRDRQDLLARLHEALQEFGAATRESRDHTSSSRQSRPFQTRTEAAGAKCAQAWADLCKHQDEHGCWRQPK